MDNEQLRCICLTAPTASGKTELSLWLAKQLPIEVVSMDSAMIYRGMNVGTAKPTDAERSAVRHHLIDIRDPAERYSAGLFVTDAIAAIRDIQAAGKLPLIVGGTMMYLRALRRGLAELPKANVSIRADLDQQAAARGWPALHAELASVDPRSGANIAANDKQRIQRALEVFRSSGRTMSQHWDAAATQHPIETYTIALVPEDRAALRERIAERFDAMLAAGMLDEVSALYSRGDLSPELPSIRCVGYRQLWPYIAGERTLDAAREQAITATRQLAKRQLTWLRSDPPEHLIELGLAAPRGQFLDVVSQVLKSWS